MLALAWIVSFNFVDLLNNSPAPCVGLIADVCYDGDLLPFHVSPFAWQSVTFYKVKCHPFFRCCLPAVLRLSVMLCENVDFLHIRPLFPDFETNLS